MKKSYMYAIVPVLIWSTLASIAKTILSALPNMEVLSISSVFAFIFLLLLNIKNGIIKKMDGFTLKDYSVISGLGFVGLFMYYALYYYGLTQLSSQEACILNYLWPIMLVIFSCIILKEKMTTVKGLAMLCSFIGIIIISVGSKESVHGNPTLGMISCIVAAACYGLFSVMNKKLNYNQNISMMIMWLVTAVASGIFGNFTESWIPIRGAQWLGLLWLGIVVCALAYLLWAYAINNTKDTSKIANLAFLTPFLSLVLSGIFLKEQIQPRAFVALIFIIGGILLQNMFEHKRK